MAPLPPSTASFPVLSSNGTRKTPRTTSSTQGRTKRQPTDLAIFKFILILLFFLLTHTTGIYFFTRGFLLTRLVLSEKSNCTQPPVPLSLADGECWYPQQFKRAIVVLIDALRYDFAVPYPPDSAEYFHNALVTPHRLAIEHPENAFLLKFIADPPTTTLQRLKGLTTGSLPTFIDAGSNFAGTAIDEDNLIDQLSSAGRRIAFMGDDTWTKLFPTQFSENMTFPYESFNVWDLDTLDNGVLTHLYPLVEKKDEWDVLIAHFLGVDHAGHRYGPNHPAMREKLRQMDSVIQRLVGMVDEDTMLVVMGDHGMDAKGDHGGDSPGEVEAALWMYSSRPAFGRIPHAESDRSAAQIDLVPTLSLLLGLPIPFNNLGGPIPEAFLRPGESYKSLATAARITAGQIRRYQEMYKNSGKVDLGPLFELHWGPAEQQWNVMQRWSERRAWPEWESMYDTFHMMQEQNLKICRRLWARFDAESMIAGIAVLLGSVLSLGTYLTAVKLERTPHETPFFTSSTLWKMLQSWGYSTGVVCLTYRNGLVAAAGVVGAVIGFVRDFWGRVKCHLRGKSISGWDYLSIAVTMASAGLFTSNSYTIWEDRITHFLLTTIGGCLLLSTLRQQVVLDKFTGTIYCISFIILVRVASHSQLCREEQMPYCRTTFYASESSSVSSPVILGILVVTAMLLPAFIKSTLLRRGWYHGSAKEWIGIGMPCLLALSAGFWIWDTATNNGWYDLQDSPGQKLLARAVLLISLFAGTVLYFIGPLCLDIDTVAGPNLGNIDDPMGRNRLQIRISGYENSLGTSYLLLLLSMYVGIAFVAKPMGGVSLAILIAQILLLLEILHINNLSTSSIGVTTLFLLANAHFFTTGHQATLPSVQWDAAFIPFTNIVYPWSPLVIIANSFGSHMIVSLAIPLLALWNVPPTHDDVLARTAEAVVLYLLQNTVVTSSSVIFAAYFRRHLMVWKIFGPRFMMAALVLLVTDLVMLVGGVAWGFWVCVVNVGAVTTRIKRHRE